MIRKLLLIGAAVAIPVGAIAATAGTAVAGKIIDNTGAPATASCTTSGGTLAFKVGIGIASPGGYTAPTKNKGNQIAVSGVNLTCTSSAVTGTFTGVASGKIKTSNPTETPAAFYSCLNLSGNNPSPGGTLSGTLKVKWSVPVGQKFGGGTKSAVTVNSTQGGTVTIGADTYGQFTIPGSTPSSIAGSFPGSDAGASSTIVAPTGQDTAALAAACTSPGGLTSLTLGSGTATLQ